MEDILDPAAAENIEVDPAEASATHMRGSVLGSIAVGPPMDLIDDPAGKSKSEKAEAAAAKRPMMALESTRAQSHTLDCDLVRLRAGAAVGEQPDPDASAGSCGVWPGDAGDDADRRYRDAFGYRACAERDPKPTRR